MDKTDKKVTNKTGSGYKEQGIEKGIDSLQRKVKSGDCQ